MAKNVLVVDESTMRQLMHGDRAGSAVAQLETTGDGVDAMAAAAAFDLILGDVDLPSWNGTVRC